MGTTNILDLNNRLSKVEKENVAQNSYTSLKNKPKINSVILTGNKSLADIGAAAAADLGELTDLTTTDKSSCVGAINEVNGFFVNLGSFTVNDLNTFFKNSVIAFHQLNPIAHRGYSVVTEWAYNGRFTGFFTDYTDSVDFVIAGGDNQRMFCGRYLLQTDTLELRTYINSNKSYSSVNLDSAYDAGTDWNIVKQGNICVMNMRNLKDIPAGWSTIGNIPVGFRPELNFYEDAYLVNNTPLEIGISSDGYMTLYNPTGATLSGEVHVNRNLCYFT